MGLNLQGKTFTASYGSATNFKLVSATVLSKWAPTDPCRQAALDYNNYVAANDTVGFNNTLGTMATNSCLAKVLLDNTNTSIKTFQPTP